MRIWVKFSAGDTVRKPWAHIRNRPHQSEEMLWKLHQRTTNKLSSSSFYIKPQIINIHQLPQSCVFMLRWLLNHACKNLTIAAITTTHITSHPINLFSPPNCCTENNQDPVIDLAADLRPVFEFTGLKRCSYWSGTSHTPLTVTVKTNPDFVYIDYTEPAADHLSELLFQKCGFSAFSSAPWALLYKVILE